ncbi:MAG: hypothetical protein HY704_11070 [Gemmatimonadetes bacterium]|nr:hypothetical protein [Gemmatimonadota bacterium]
MVRGALAWWRLRAALALAVPAAAGACAERGDEAVHEPPAVDLRALAPRVMIGSPGEMEVVPGDSLVLRLTMLNAFDMGPPGPGHLVVAVGDRIVDHYSASEPVVLRDLPPGCHLLRVAVVEASGRTLDTPGSLDFRNVCVGERGRPVAPSGTPILFSSAPRDSAAVAPGDSLFVDFRVSGAVLSPDNYRVRWQWDERAGELAEPGPLWIKEGLEAGVHRLHLELVGSPDQPAGVPVIERTVTIEVP